jgi:hypothetical protein
VAVLVCTTVHDTDTSQRCFGTSTDTPCGLLLLLLLINRAINSTRASSVCDPLAISFIECTNHPTSATCPAGGANNARICYA